MLGFGGLGLQGLQADSLAKLSDFSFIATDVGLSSSGPTPGNVSLVPARQENYTDLIAASDVVVSKPGFGMVAACLAERATALHGSG